MILIDPADPPSALPRGARLGEFEIRRVLGAGGFGIVYLAFDHALEREVAIKEYMPVSMAGRTAAFHVSLLSQSHAESFALGLRSFVNEARLLARFDHPSLVKVHRYWAHNNTAYMAMPFYAGHSLQRTRRHLLGPPAEAYVRSILEPLLGALDRLHSEGVYHRDISPDNIIVAPDGRPVLLDFGAARRVLADMSVALTAILKPAYAPIEQYGETGAVKQGPWTDLYALGATMRHLLLGQAPAPATTRTVVDELVPLAGQALPGCSPAFLQCIDWMLQPRPADRPQCVAALREALDACRPARLASPQPARAAGRWETTQRLDPAAGPAHQATMFDPSLAPSTVRVSPAPQAEHTQVLTRHMPPGDPTVLMPVPQEVTQRSDGAAPAAPDLAPSISACSPAAPPVGGRTEPTLGQAAADLTAAAHPPPRAPQRPVARRWPLAAGGIGAAVLLGLALWSTGSRGPAPASASLASVPAASAAQPTAPLPASSGTSVTSGTSGTSGTAVAAVSAAALVPADDAPTAKPARPAATFATASVATAPAKTLTQAPTTGRPPAPAATLAGRSAAPPAAPPTITAVAAAPTIPASADPAGRPGLATSITRLPAADAPPPTRLPTPPLAAPATVAGATQSPNTTVALPSPTPASTKLTAAAAGPGAATAAPATAAPAGSSLAGPAAAGLNPTPTTTARPPAPAPARAADPDHEPVLVQARALGPSERCEGRVLVALWACVERQCKTDASLRDHPECQKLRREQ